VEVAILSDINWNELLEDPDEVEASLLERVVGIAQGRTVDGVTVELHSLEIRTLGAFGLLRTEYPPHVTSQGFDRLTPEIAATDDRGTRYSALVVGKQRVPALAPSSGPERGSCSSHLFRTTHGGSTYRSSASEPSG
jgi:hypothetical protein